MKPSRKRFRYRGFTYLGVIFLIAGMGVALTSIVQIWSTERQRQKEIELIKVGNAFRDAIGLYYQRSPGSVKRYPRTIEELLEDRRYLSLQRYLRKIFRSGLSSAPPVVPPS